MLDLRSLQASNRDFYSQVIHKLLWISCGSFGSLKSRSDSWFGSATNAFGEARFYLFG